MNVTILGLVAVSYLIGSIPFAWLIARAVKGQDLRQLGSGNVGVMNTALSVGRWAGLLVFFLEAAKGIAVAVLTQTLAGTEPAITVAILAAVVGTRWPIWLRGAGGRGNTTGMAAVLVISWPAVVLTLITWAVARLVFRGSFWATRITIFFMPFIFGLSTRSWWYFLLGIGLSLLYLSTQKPETDDHLILKERWTSLWDFISSPRRK